MSSINTTLDFQADLVSDRSFQKGRRKSRPLSTHASQYVFRYSFEEPRGLEYVSPNVIQLTGYTQEELTADPDLLARILLPGDLDLFRKRLSENSISEPVTLRWIRKSGEIQWSEIRVVAATGKGSRLSAIEGILSEVSPFGQELPGVETEVTQRVWLIEASRHLSAASSEVDLFARTLKTLQKAIPFNACRLLVKEDCQSLFQDIKASPETGPYHFSVETISQDDPALHSSLKTGKPGLIRHMRQDPAEKDEQALSSDEQWAIFPIRIHGIRAGAFLIARSLAEPFTQAEFDFAQILINLTTLAMENLCLARKVEIHEKLIKNLTPINETVTQALKKPDVSRIVGQGAASISGADRVAIYGHDPDEKITHLWSQGLSLTSIERIISLACASSPNGLYKNPKVQLVTDKDELPAGSHWRVLAESEGVQSIAICPIICDGQIVAHVDCYFNKRRKWSDLDRVMLEIFSRQASAAFGKSKLNEELEATYMQTILALAKAMDARDAYTANHSRRLADWAVATAKRLNCSDEEVEVIRWAALLHDIGKIGIPDAILNKAGPLTDDEWEVMKRHPELGAEIISPMEKLQEVTTIVRAHQEKYDGSGYPDGLAGEQIPLAARILTVVDAYGAMTDDRVFRKARSSEEATAELYRCAGKHFDRRVVDTFSQVLSGSRMSAHPLSSD